MDYEINSLRTTDNPSQRTKNRCNGKEGGGTTTITMMTDHLLPTYDENGLLRGKLTPLIQNVEDKEKDRNDDLAPFFHVFDQGERILLHILKY